MNIMIFDDNPTFVKQLHDRIIDYFTARSSQCQCETVTSTAHMVSTDLSKIDILFLDINMPEINEIHLARILRRKYPEIYIVFVTGWIEYAPAGYHVKAFRYLLKSQLDDELCRCINDIIDDIRNKKEYVRISGKKAAIDIGISDIYTLKAAFTKRSCCIRFTPTARLLNAAGSWPIMKGNFS